MKLTTFEFYTNEFYGSTIEAAAFDMWQTKAADKLNYICGGRINPDDVNEAIEKAVCEVADTLYKLDYAEKHAHDAEHGNIKSMSSGGQSISFGENDTVYSKAVGDSRAQIRLIIDKVTPYLWDTGLMWAGV